MRTQFRSLAVAAGLAAGLVCGASADPVTLNIQWSGAVFSNSATATGFITFDAAVLRQIRQVRQICAFLRSATPGLAEGNS